MTAFHVGGALTGLAALTSISFLMEPQESAQAQLVEIKGLKSTYASCAHVDISVHNISKQELHVQVHVEYFDSGRWTAIVTKPVLVATS